jgi:hypothetical protein
MQLETAYKLKPAILGTVSSVRVERKKKNVKNDHYNFYVVVN